MNESLSRFATSLKYILCNAGLSREIRNSERNLLLGRNTIATLQLQKLKNIITYAYGNCKFYKKLYDGARLTPRDITCLADVAKLPMVGKDDIRENLKDFVSSRASQNRMESVHTGGTTGIPLKLYRDRSKMDLMNAIFIRTIRRWGCGVGSKIVWVWGLPRGMSERYDFIRQSRVRIFYRNVAWFDAFDMTEKRMKSFTDFLMKFRPSLIVGYVSALYEYAKFLVGNRLPVHSPKAVCITAEPSDYSQRELIEEAFGARTYDEYGSTEILRIAAECGERTGLHVHADSRYVEIVNSQGKHAHVGEPGEVVVTDLENRVVPLIRYRTGDVTSWHGDACTCGISFPLMNPVRGRIYDIITLKNGKKIYGHMFSRVLFSYVQEIKQFQVHQHTLGRIRIRIVPGNMCNPERMKSEIIRRLKQYTGEQVAYSYDLVNNIAREKSGKLRYVKSDVSS